MSAGFFEGFEQRRVATRDAEINLRIGGSGDPLVLLHGYPQTHAMWHDLAPKLAERHTVICPDLRGYGDSAKPPGGGNHALYSKRAMAADVVQVMDDLGFRRFGLVGHDRGARVTHRLCLDHPERVRRACVIDIAPTLTMYRQTDMAFAAAYFHWFYLIQPYDLPERMIAADPSAWLRHCLGAWGKSGLKVFASEALAEYERCFDPAGIHATCEDYRASATIDLEHDEADAGERIDCPLLVLWGEKGVVQRTYDVLAVWRAKAEKVEGQALPCGHFVPEEAPAETLAALEAFF
ncbi:alpha/beta fold hydrolase [Algihabitans albus]|uniref:alpha/beta fold hydrolase n=1 Tax=Algihabitans albus TaxID=2164067 RepID=UPI001F36D883|nr:alpha/beta hydrolase [Algihabitans albus]